MIRAYLRSFSLTTVLVFGSSTHCMDTAEGQKQATQDLLNAASQGNCASIRNALCRGAKPNCFGIAKMPKNPVAQTITPPVPTATDAAQLFVTSIWPTAPAKILSPISVATLPITPTIECTPVHLAAKNGHYDAVKILLEARADARVSTRNNTSTPLHAAIQGDKGDKRDVKTVSEVRSAIAALLIKHGASIHTQDFTGKTALDYLQPADTESTKKKDALISNYRWKQGTLYGKWVCGALVVGFICVGIQHVYNRYYRSHHDIDKDTHEIQEIHTDNGANDEEQ